jgi:ABC-type transport system involved in multi-copper enzyme maturation permease subunit
MEFTLLKNIKDYFKNSMCSKTVIFTLLGSIIFSSIMYLVSYFVKRNKKIALVLVFVFISLIFLINFIYDMGKKGQAPEMSSPAPISSITEEEDPIVEPELDPENISEPAPDSIETENFALY